MLCRPCHIIHESVHITYYSTSPGQIPPLNIQIIQYIWSLTPRGFCSPVSLVTFPGSDTGDLLCSTLYSNQIGATNTNEQHPQNYLKLCWPEAFLQLAKSSSKASCPPHSLASTLSLGDGGTAGAVASASSAREQAARGFPGGLLDPKQPHGPVTMHLTE